MSKVGIIIGATGLTGNYLIKELLEDKRYSKLVVISRRPLGIKHEKMEEHIVQLLDTNDWTGLIQGDHVFCCIGTTRKKTPDKKLYYKIDFGIPKKIALAGKKNGVTGFAVISAIGANSESSIFYNRLKGEMENAIKKDGPDLSYIMRPSIIDGSRKENRLLEKIGLVGSKLIGFLLVGRFKKYRLIHAQDIAVAMIEIVNSSEKKMIYESDEIQSLADRIKFTRTGQN